MPKRDDAYMAAQRRAITLAALDVLLDKGIHKTTLRDVCRKADISIGALYTHFVNMDELIIAACGVDYDSMEFDSENGTWVDYMEHCRLSILGLRDERTQKRARLSYQIIAKQMLDRENMPGLSELYKNYRLQFFSVLGGMRDRGEIILPHGLDATVDFHIFSWTGAAYMAHSNKDTDLEVAADRLVHALHANVIVNNAAGRRLDCAEEAPAPSRSLPS